MRYLIPLLFLLTSCSMILSSKDVDEQILLWKAQSQVGCGFLKANGNPPASRVDGGVMGGWGPGMDAAELNTCIEGLKGLP